MLAIPQSIQHILIRARKERFYSAKSIVFNANAKSADIGSSYERKTPIEHVLLRPGMYVGQIESTVADTWVYDQDTKAMTKSSSVTYSPALLKIFDEIIVNAADNRHRDPKNMTYIDVDITSNDEHPLIIAVKNDGKGIPVVKHPTEKIFIPELIFGHLLTGSNFDDSQVNMISIVQLFID